MPKHVVEANRSYLALLGMGSEWVIQLSGTVKLQEARDSGW
jgi:hypothetical protein